MSGSGHVVQEEWRYSKQHVDSKVTGAHPGTERDMTWESEATGLTVRETIDRRIGGTFPYRMHLEVRLIR